VARILGLALEEEKETEELSPEEEAAVRCDARLALSRSTPPPGQLVDRSDSSFSADLNPKPMAQNPWTLHFLDAESESEYFESQWGARRRLLRVSVPAAAVVAVATVLWTVRYPEHGGDVIIPAADVPLLAWIAAGATLAAVIAARLLAAMSPSVEAKPRSGKAGDRSVPAFHAKVLSSKSGRISVFLPSFVRRGAVFPLAESIRLPRRTVNALEFGKTVAQQAAKISNRRLEPLLSLVIVLLCLAYSLVGPNRWCLPRHPTTHFDPRFLSQMASHDVDVVGPRRYCPQVIDTHF